MKDWQKRVVEEHKELGEKINKLYVFLTADGAELKVSLREWLRLQAQGSTMLKYHNILGARIADFEDEAET